MPYLFDQLDLNHDGVVDYNEVLGIYKIFGCTDERSRVSNLTKILILTILLRNSIVSSTSWKSKRKWNVLHANK